MEMIINLLKSYPLDFDTTMILLGFVWGAAQFIWRKEYDKLAKFALEESTKLVTSTLDNEARRDKVVLMLHSKAPVWFKAFISAEQLDQLVDYVYVTQVKPKAKLQGLEGVKINTDVLDKHEEELKQLFDMR